MKPGRIVVGGCSNTPNGVALREMAQRNVEWYSINTNSVALGRIALQNIRRSI